MTTATGASQAILLRGPSGSGKSDLALRLISAGALLVADDRVDLGLIDGRLVAAPPPALAGLLEVRGVGLCRLPFVTSVPLVAVIDLVPREAVPRLPEVESASLLDIAVPRFALHAFDAATVDKIAMVLAVVNDPEKVIR